MSYYTESWTYLKTLIAASGDQMTMLQQNSILSALFLSLLVFASCEGSIIIDKAEREVRSA